IALLARARSMSCDGETWTPAACRARPRATVRSASVPCAPAVVMSPIAGRYRRGRHPTRHGQPPAWQHLGRKQERGVSMAEYTTVFGSWDDYEKGRVIVIDDDPKAYVFSNVFEVASNAKPYEKVAVGKNLEYVLEVIRCEGTSEWRVTPHDE